MKHTEHSKLANQASKLAGRYPAGTQKYHMHMRDFHQHMATHFELIGNAKEAAKDRTAMARHQKFAVGTAE